MTRAAATDRPPLMPHTKSWSFDGSTSYARNASVDFSTYNKLAISGWINIGGATGVLQTIFETTNSFIAASGIWMGLSSTGALEGGYSDVGVGYSYWSFATLPRGRWVHIALAVDRTAAVNVGAKLYVNGVLSGVNTLATATGGGNFNAAASLNFGARGAASAFFRGQLKDFRISTFSTFAASDALDLYLNRSPLTVIHQWSGEDTSTTTATADTGGKDLTLTSVTYSDKVPSKTRRSAVDVFHSLKFAAASGSSAHGNVYDKERTDAFSVSFWVKYSDVTGIMVGRLRTAGTITGWEFTHLAGNYTYFTLNSDGASNGIVLRIPLQYLKFGTWTHFVATYTGSSLASGTAIYMNGALAQTTIAQNNLTTSTLGGGVNFTIGARAGGSTGLTDGHMTRVRMHSRSLTASEVLDLYYNDVAVAVDGEWLMTDGGGTTLTGTQGGPNGTITTPVWSIEVPSNRRLAVRDTIYSSLTFPATTSRVSIPNTANLRPGAGSFAVAFWLRTTGASTTSSIVQGGTSSVASYTLYLASATQLSVYVQSGGASATFTGLPFGKIGAWNRIFVTFNFSDLKVRLYINGRLFGVSAAITTWNITDTAAHEIGSTTNGLNASAGISMSDLSFYKGTVPTDAEVAADYFSGVQAPNCVHRYLFSDGFGASPTDSIAGNTASLAGATVPVFLLESPIDERSYGSEAEYVALIASDGAIHHWKMDEASGNFAPTIGAITLNATAMNYRTSGRLSEMAARFNGMTSHAETASALSLSGYSRVVVEAIIWLEELLSTTDAFLWETGTHFVSGAGRFVCALDGGNSGSAAKGIIGVSGNVGLNYYEVTRPQAKKWFHIVQVIDFSQATPANETKLYIDGVEQAINGVSSVASSNTGNLTDQILNVGARNAGGSGIFGKLKMQHLAVYANASMPLDRIQAHALYVNRFRSLP